MTAYPPRRKRRGEHFFEVGLEHFACGGPFDRERRPHPLRAHARKQRDVLPQLRGALADARSPRLDQAYSGTREMFAPHSSTKTKRSGPVSAATVPRQAALKNSSRSVAPSDLFFG
jgi:hypothetical protein